jgi:hypothetical protein
MSSARFHTQRRAGTFVVRFLVSAVRLTLLPPLTSPASRRPRSSPADRHRCYQACR